MMLRSWGPNRAECEPVDALLEGYVDDDLEVAERSVVERHLDGCAACRAELELANSVATGLRSLPLVERRASQAGRPAVAAPTRETGPWSATDEAPSPKAAKPQLWSHPLLQAAAILLLLSGAWIAFSDAPFMERAGSDRPGSPFSGDETYTEAEIRAAEEDLRIALAYFGRLAGKAGIAVRDDVLRDRVVEPTSRAFQRIGDFGIEGQTSSRATGTDGIER